MKKTVPAVIAVFVALAVVEFLLHSVLLAGIYEQTAGLWRTMDEIKSLSWLMHVSYLILAVVLVIIYSKGYEPAKPGLAQGLRFGVLTGLFMSVPMALNCYAVMPIPVSLALGWFVGGMTEMLIAGALIGLMYRR